MSELETKLISEIEKQLRFETLLAEISTHFINLPADRIDHEIEAAQRRISEFFGIDRSTIWQQLNHEPGRYVFTHVIEHEDVQTVIKPKNTSFSLNGKWKVQASDGYPVHIQLEISRDFPWIFSQVIQHGKIVLFSRIEELPPEAIHDAEMMFRYGTKADVIIPLMVGGTVIGCITFAMIRAAREWSQAMVKQLSLIAQIFANALSRKKIEYELRKSESRLSLAAASADAGLWVLDIDTGLIWCTDKAQKLFCFAPDDTITFDGFLNRVHAEDREQVRQEVQSEKDINIEYRIVLPDGAIRWISSRGRMHAETPGEPPRLTGVSIDVTDRRESERLLHKAYNEIKALKDRIETENIYLRKEIYPGDIFKNIIGRSNALKLVLQRVEQVASVDSTVLLSGETGTGKELIAQAIHDLSKRKGGLLVKVNCASLPATLIESELFGREKGAYTGSLARQIGRFELANHSTLLLDEITELPLDLQAKLLRVLQNGEFERLGSPKTIRVDVRLIAATNRDITMEVKKGAFREDLYYRLQVFPIVVPPLRERIDDIPLLVEAFINEFSTKMNKKFLTVSRKTMDQLQSYHWPGNIRQLRNAIEQAVIISSGNNLQITLPHAPGSADVEKKTLKDKEYQHILEVLTKTRWRVKGSNGAAELLGIKPSTLFSKMKKHGIRNNHKKDGILS